MDEGEIRRIVDALFMSFNDKDLEAIKSSLHPDVSMPGDGGQTASTILAAAIAQLPVFDGYRIKQIIPEGGRTKAIRNYKVTGQSQNLTFVLGNQGRFRIIDMFEVNVQP